MKGLLSTLFAACIHPFRVVAKFGASASQLKEWPPQELHTLRANAKPRSVTKNRDWRSTFAETCYFAYKLYETAMGGGGGGAPRLDQNPGGALWEE